MSGHSKWHQIRHRKFLIDAKRGQIFSKIIREIMIAAREGGITPEANLRLRTAIGHAKSVGMPKENIERAISRVSSSGDAALQEMTYEAYGPGGSAFLIRGVTDNANRTTSEIKKILAEFGGKIAEAGSVSWMLERPGIFKFAAPLNREESARAQAMKEALEEHPDITEVIANIRA